MSEVSEALFQAVGILIDKKIQAISFDQTIKAEIIDDTNASEGEYLVDNGSSKFFAYSNEVKYKNKDAVLVTIPEGDYSNQKMIIGKQVNKNNEPITYVSPFSTIIDLTNNLITGSHELAFWANEDKGVTDNELFSRIKNRVDKSDKSGYPSHTWDISLNDFRDSQAYKFNFEPLWDSRLANNGVDIVYAHKTRIGLQAQFSTWLGDYNTILGNYGLALAISFKCTDIVVENDENVEGENVFTKVVTFDCEDFFGNPYEFETYVTQTVVFDIGEYDNYPITRIRLYAYQRGNFKTMIGEDVPTHSLDSFDNINPNIFIKDPYICLGKPSADFIDDELEIYTEQSLTYYKSMPNENASTISQRQTDNRKVIDLNWVHRFEDGVRLVEQDIIPEDYEIRWYRYKLGAKSPDQFAGAHWERFYGINKDGNNYIEDNGDYCITDLLYRMYVAEYGNKDIDVATNSLTIEFMPNFNLQSEKIKAIIIKKEAVESDISVIDQAGVNTYQVSYTEKFIVASPVLEFTNDDSIRNSATYFDMNALSISFEDDEKGRYFLYNRAGDVISDADTRIRILQARFDKEEHDIYKKALLNVNECKSIEWTFPTGESMIISATAADPSATPSGATTFTNVGSVGYSIKKKLNRQANDNTVRLTVIKDGEEYHAAAQMAFGTGGTNGSDYTLDVVWDNSTSFALDVTNPETASLKGKVKLYATTSEAEDPGEISDNWELSYDWAISDYIEQPNSNKEAEYDYSYEEKDILYPVFYINNSYNNDTDKTEDIKKKVTFYKEQNNIVNNNMYLRDDDDTYGGYYYYLDTINDLKQDLKTIFIDNTDNTNSPVTGTSLEDISLVNGVNLKQSGERETILYYFNVNEGRFNSLNSFFVSKTSVEEINSELNRVLTTEQLYRRRRTIKNLKLTPILKNEEFFKDYLSLGFSDVNNLYKQLVQDSDSIIYDYLYNSEMIAQHITNKYYIKDVVGEHKELVDDETVEVVNEEAYFLLNVQLSKKRQEYENEEEFKTYVASLRDFYIKNGSIYEKVANNNTDVYKEIILTISPIVNIYERYLDEGQDRFLTSRNSFSNDNFKYVYWDKTAKRFEKISINSIQNLFNQYNTLIKDKDINIYKYDKLISTGPDPVINEDSRYEFYKPKIDFVPLNNIYSYPSGENAYYGETVKWAKQDENDIFWTTGAVRNKDQNFYRDLFQLFFNDEISNNQNFFYKSELEKRINQLLSIQNICNLLDDANPTDEYDKMNAVAIGDAYSGSNSQVSMYYQLIMANHNPYKILDIYNNAIDYLHNNIYINGNTPVNSANEEQLYRQIKSILLGEVYDSEIAEAFTKNEYIDRATLSETPISFYKYYNNENERIDFYPEKAYLQESNKVILLNDWLFYLRDEVELTSAEQKVRYEKIKNESISNIKHLSEIQNKSAIFERLCDISSLEIDNNYQNILGTALLSATNDAFIDSNNINIVLSKWLYKNNNNYQLLNNWLNIQTNSANLTQLLTNLNNNSNLAIKSSVNNDDDYYTAVLKYISKNIGYVDGANAQANKITNRLKGNLITSIFRTTNADALIEYYETSGKLKTKENVRDTTISTAAGYGEYYFVTSSNNGKTTYDSLLPIFKDVATNSTTVRMYFNGIYSNFLSYAMSKVYCKINDENEKKKFLYGLLFHTAAELNGIDELSRIENWLDTLTIIFNAQVSSTPGGSVNLPFSSYYAANIPNFVTNNDETVYFGTGGMTLTSYVEDGRTWQVCQIIFQILSGAISSLYIETESDGQITYTPITSEDPLKQYDIKSERVKAKLKLIRFYLGLKNDSNLDNDFLNNINYDEIYIGIINLLANNTVIVPSNTSLYKNLDSDFGEPSTSFNNGIKDVINNNKESLISDIKATCKSMTSNGGYQVLTQKLKPKIQSICNPASIALKEVSDYAHYGDIYKLLFSSENMVSKDILNEVFSNKELFWEYFQKFSININSQTVTSGEHTVYENNDIPPTNYYIETVTNNTYSYAKIQTEINDLIDTEIRKRPFASSTKDLAEAALEDNIYNTLKNKIYNLYIVNTNSVCKIEDTTINNNTKKNNLLSNILGLLMGVVAVSAGATSNENTQYYTYNGSTYNPVEVADSQSLTAGYFEPLLDYKVYCSLCLNKNKNLSVFGLSLQAISDNNFTFTQNGTANALKVQDILNIASYREFKNGWDTLLKGGKFKIENNEEISEQEAFRKIYLSLSGNNNDIDLNTYLTNLAAVMSSAGTSYTLQLKQGLSEENSYLDGYYILEEEEVAFSQKIFYNILDEWIKCFDNSNGNVKDINGLNTVYNNIINNNNIYKVLNFESDDTNNVKNNIYKLYDISSIQISYKDSVTNQMDEIETALNSINQSLYNSTSLRYQTQNEIIPKSLSDYFNEPGTERVYNDGVSTKLKLNAINDLYQLLISPTTWILTSAGSGGIDESDSDIVFNYDNTSHNKAFIKINEAYVIDPFDEYNPEETYYQPVQLPKRETRTNPLVVSKLDSKDEIIIYPNSSWTNSNELMNTISVLRVTLSNFGDYDLEAYFPIPLKNGTTYDAVTGSITYTIQTIEGATEVRYSSAGETEYEKNPYRIYALIHQDSSGSSLQELTTSGHWELNYNGFNNFIPSLAEADKTANLNNSQWFKKPILKPIPVYIPYPEAPSFAVQYKRNDNNNTILWTQPIWVYQDNYPSTTLNKWNGKDIHTDQETGTIVSSAIAAGKKEYNNTFSGVMMGDWSRSDTDIAVSAQTGVYGFNKGAMSYAFKQDGTGFIGKDGKGRIHFDGDKSQIYSNNWKGFTKAGMFLDVDDGIIKLHSDPEDEPTYTYAGSVQVYKESELNKLENEELQRFIFLLDNIDSNWQEEVKSLICKTKYNSNSSTEPNDKTIASDVYIKIREK